MWHWNCRGKKWIKLEPIKQQRIKASNNICGVIKTRNYKCRKEEWCLEATTEPWAKYESLPLGFSYTPLLASSSCPQTLSYSHLQESNGVLQLHSVSSWPVVCTFIMVLSAMPMEKPHWTLPRPPISFCLTSTLCDDYKETTQQRNLKWKALTWCDLHEVEKGRQQSSVCDLSHHPPPSTSSPTCACVLMPIHSPSAPNNRDAPIFQVQHTHTNKLRRPLVFPFLLFKYFINVYIQCLPTPLRTGIGSSFSFCCSQRVAL